MGVKQEEEECKTGFRIHPELLSSSGSLFLVNFLNQQIICYQGVLKWSWRENVMLVDKIIKVS